MNKKWIRGIGVSLPLALVSGCGAQQAPSNVISESTLSTVNGIVLDYAEGTAQGVYGWTLSKDGGYYMLSALNEDGTVKESEAAQSFMGGSQDGMLGDISNVQGNMRGEMGATQDNASMTEDSQMNPNDEQGGMDEVAFTPKEFSTLMCGLPCNLLGNSIRVLLVTGLRVQELLALTRDDIEEDGSIIHVTKAVKTVHGNPLLGTTKSERSVRDIPVAKCYRGIVVALREQGAAHLYGLPRVTIYYIVSAHFVGSIIA